VLVAYLLPDLVNLGHVGAAFLRQQHRGDDFEAVFRHFFGFTLVSHVENPF
jgi:hypothetical protein